MKLAIIIAAGVIASPVAAQSAGEWLMWQGRNLDASSSLPQQSAPQKPVGAVYKGEYKDKHSRICIYNNMGSRYILTVNITQNCPR